MLQKIVRILGGNPHKREVQQLSETVDEINELEPDFIKLSDEALRAKTEEFRQRLQEGETLDDLLPEAFATVREASKRTIGLRPYDVQMIGGMTLHAGKIAEMRTGEGKTLVATLPLYLNAITGRGVHLVTVNDYLARRDARWMAPIYYSLGLKVGVLQMASRTENGIKAFVINPEKRSPLEDQDQLELVHRKEAYQADIVYGTNSEFGFDYLRDNLTMRLEDRVQRGHYYAIVDEVDNILIDEARTPLIISGPASDDVQLYYTMANVIRQLNPEDYEISEKDRNVSLTEIGDAHVEELLDSPLRDPERPEDITPEQARLLGYLEQALRAQFLFRRNKDYLVQSGKVIIIDEFTGRLMPGRRWSDGLHQAVEAKEGVKVEPENATYATITIQNYFRMYEKLAGMTGTALTEAEEFYKIYKLNVLPIPTNLEYVAIKKDAQLVEQDGKDDHGYKTQFYSLRDDPHRKPVYWRRQDFPDVVYRTEEAKLRAIILEILHYYVMGRPQLVGTTSVEHSERLSQRLAAEPIRRMLQAQMVRDAYLEVKKVQIVERAIPELAPLNKPVDNLEAGELRLLVRSLGLNLTLNLDEPENLARLRKILEVGEEDTPRLLKAIQGGISHQVLNARKHDEESQIIARAGAFGSITIATNMAGRGVDIKLGGELPDEILADVIRVLNSAGVPDPYDLSNEERRQALLNMTPDKYGIYDEAIRAFTQYLDDMKSVRQLGGLHVIGSERHEARRIDNQLRGRAARQGDPGSSRFYLSLEDELMRLFGGQQAEGLFKRLNIDENIPIESGILGRLVEQSQERVEGYNFDVRKHLLEYDDVLNAQRKRIYTQRDRVFTKEDLSEDVLEMMRTDLQERIPKSLKDEEGPWKLLAYLEQVQPAVEFEDLFYPSFSLRLLLEKAHSNIRAGSDPVFGVRDAMLEVAEQALLAEKEHVMHWVRGLLDKTAESLEQQRQERFEILDNYFSTLGKEPEEGEEVAVRRPQEILDELSSLMRLPMRLSGDLFRRLPEGGDDIETELRHQTDDALLAITINRLLGAVERRIEESSGLRMANLVQQGWDAAAENIYQATEALLNKRFERYLGEQGQIAHDIDPILQRNKESAPDDRALLSLLRMMGAGARLSFDRRTHRQAWRRYDRLNYAFMAAKLLESVSPQRLTEDVLEHLEEAREVLESAWGNLEFSRLASSNATLSQFEETLQTRFIERLTPEHLEEIRELPLAELAPEDAAEVRLILGRRMQNEIYRSLLLTAISEQWVEYLTKVEGLRVSIGMEAYAQRDPLVQYKGKATELFRELLADIRSAVIGRMYTMQPRRGSEAMADRGETPPADVEATSSARQPLPEGPAPNGQDQPVQNDDRRKKRKRH
jgi:preprotein translocase subunit SecA